MRAWLAVLVGGLLAGSSAHAQAAKPGDIVRVEAASLSFGGELVADEPDALRLKLESGVIAIPRSLITSVTVVRSAPSPPAIAAPPAPGAPTLRKPKGVWLSRWGSGLTLSAIGGMGGAHDTPVKARRSPGSAGGSVGYERSFAFVSAGTSLSYEQMQETLVASSKQACPSNAGGDCFEFPDGLAHTTSAFGALLYVKPYLMLGRVRPWLRAGGEVANVAYSYRSTSETYGDGSTTAFGVRYGGGIDFATKRRGLVMTLGLDAGGAHYREKIPRLFGAPWKSDDAGTRSTDLRLEAGVTIPFGGRL